MKKIKSIFCISILIFIISSCKKEIIHNQPKIQSVENQQKLHGTGLILTSPFLIEKIGYYKPSENLKQSLPSSIDFSNKMPAVGNQGTSESCVGWAVGYYYKTFQEVREKGWNATSNAYSPAWVYNQINSGRDDGSKCYDALKLLGDYGCDFNENFPFDFNHLKQPDDGSKINAAHYKADKFSALDKFSTVEDLKSILASSQLFVIEIPVYPDLDNLGIGNEVYDDLSGRSRGDHAVCVVGYNDNMHAFKFINSWGTDEGINGYGWIDYNTYIKILSGNNYHAWICYDKKNTYDTKYLVGDFNGDKIQDIFTANGYRFYVSWSGKSGLKALATSSISVTSLAVGDFNGDGKSDIFYPTGSEWKVSYSGTGAWTKINYSGVTLSNMKFGDFNGDKKTDIFYPNGSEWRVSYSGSSHWNIINESDVTIGYMDLGDFNGDGKSDVFYANGSEWKVSYSGTGGWNKINGSSVKISYLKLADFNGDGKSDVFYPNGSEWKICYSGKGDWIRINGSAITLKDLGFGNFNSDKKYDVVHATTAYWKVSWSGTSDWKEL